MADPVLLADASGKLLYINSVAAEWLGLKGLPSGLTLEQALGLQVDEPVSLLDLWETVNAGKVWTARQTYLHSKAGRREGKIRIFRIPSPRKDANVIYLTQIHDLSEDLAELRVLAEQERTDLLLDLLGSTTVELGNSLASLRWAADLTNEAISTLPLEFRNHMEGLRIAARQLNDLFQDLETHLSTGSITSEPGDLSVLSRDVVKVEPAVRVLITGATVTQAACIADDLRRADLYCLVRTAKDGSQAVRSAIAGEVDAVVVGDRFSREQFRELVKTLGLSAPGIPVFDPTGVSTEVLIRGIRGALKESKRGQSANRAWRSIEEIALRDPLTGVLNRRALDRFGKLEFVRAQRYGFPLGLALFDLDNFKEVNDQLGHAEGDRALQLFSSAVQAGVREMDIVARLGGDEFVVLMPHTDPQGALISLQRLRQSAEDLMRGRLTQIFPKLGVSAGLATFPDAEVGTYEELLGRADQALYKAKRLRKQERLKGS